MYYSYLILIFAGLACGGLRSLWREPLLGWPISPGSLLWYRHIASHRPHPSRPALVAPENWRAMWRARMYSTRKVGILCLHFIILSAILSPSHTHHVCLIPLPPQNAFMPCTWIVSALALSYLITRGFKSDLISPQTCNWSYSNSSQKFLDVYFTVINPTQLSVSLCVGRYRLGGFKLMSSHPTSN